MTNIDPHILSTLTDEERAAIEGDDMTPEERAALSEIADDDLDEGGEGDGDELDKVDEDDDDGQPDDEQGSGPDSDASVAAAAEQAAVQQQEPVPVIESSPDPEPVVSAAQRQPAYRAELPPDFGAKVEELRAKEASLIESFKAGDLDFDDYRAQTAALQQEAAALERAVTKAEIAREIAEQTAQQAWFDSVNRMADAAKRDGIDYRQDATKQRDLDVFIKALAADQGNQDKPADWFLQEAHKRVMALHGVVAAKPAAAGPADTKKPAARKPPVDALPKTLAQVPGGDGPGDVADEFADVDSLSGDALESAIARMTPAQRERYLAGA